MGDIDTAGVLRWEKHTVGGTTRFYEVRLQKDLWGAPMLTRIWGRRGSSHGRVTHTPVPEHDKARMIAEIARRRLQHRYVLTMEQKA